VTARVDDYERERAIKRYGQTLRRRSAKAMRVLHEYISHFETEEPRLHRALFDYVDAQQKLRELRHALREKT
jgi:hypothetical protein